MTLETGGLARGLLPISSVLPRELERIILAFTHPLRQCTRADYVTGVNTHGENAL